MKRVILIISLVALYAVMTQASECKKIVITSDPDYPPLSWRDPANPDKIIGVAIELAEKAFKEMGLEVESKYFGPWTRTLFNAETGNVDMVAGVYINEERKAYMDFLLPPFITDPNVLFVMKGKMFKFEKWEDLIGLEKGIARLGDSYGDAFDKFDKEKLSIPRAESFDLLFNTLKAGRSRYILFGLYPGLIEAEKIGVKNELEYLPIPVTSEGVYMAFSKKSKCIVDQALFGQKIQALIEAKVPDALVEKYIKIWKEQQTTPVPKK